MKALTVTIAIPDNYASRVLLDDNSAPVVELNIDGISFGADVLSVTD